MAAGAAAVVCRQRRRCPHLRNRLVPDARALRGLVVGVDWRAAGHLHGGHVSRQLSAAALHLAQASPAEGLRAARDRDRHHRPAVARRASARRLRLHGVGRLWHYRIPAPWARRQHLPPAADPGDGRHAPGRCTLGADDAALACRGSDFSTPATSLAPSWARCSRASICCASST